MSREEIDESTLFCYSPTIMAEFEAGINRTRNGGQHASLLEVPEVMLANERSSFLGTVQRDVLAPREDTWMGIMHIIRETDPSRVAVGYYKNGYGKIEEPTGIRVDWSFFIYDLDSDRELRTHIRLDCEPIPDDFKDKAWDWLAAALNPKKRKYRPHVARRIRSIMPDYATQLSASVTATVLGEQQEVKLHEVEGVKPGGFDQSWVHSSLPSDGALLAQLSDSHEDPSGVIQESFATAFAGDRLVGDSVGKQFAELREIAAILEESAPDFQAIDAFMA